MILVDFNGIAISAIVTQDVAPDESLIRHIVLNSIRANIKRFKKQYGPEVIIACDSRSWRKEYFPHYKFKRKGDREKSDRDWDAIFEILTKIINEISLYLPYKVIKVHGAEADDIIAALTIQTQEFNQHQNVMIISADKDFVQLHRFGNVKQYSSMQSKMVREKDISGYMFEHIIRGDKGDGVPNVLSHDDIFVTGGRQKAITKKKLEEWSVAKNDDSKLESIMDKDTYRNYLRNKTLVNFDYIPADITKEILDAYSEAEDTPRSRMMGYFISKRCRNLIETISDF